MNNKINGILFFDIDGTLVNSSAGETLPSQSTLNAIHKAQENGYLCFIASGRNMANLHMFDYIGMDGIVFADGGGIKLGNQQFSYGIPNNKVEQLIDQIVNQYHGGMRLAAWNRCYLCPQFYDFFMSVSKKMAKNSGAEPDAFFKTFNAYPFSEWNGEEILEIDITLPNKETEKEWIKQKDDSIHYIFTGMSFGDQGSLFGELTLEGVSKASGCQKVMDHYGVDYKNTYAFGDSMNDGDMLRHVGTGIAMGNADDNLKAMADYITDSVGDDGIATALKHFQII